MGVRITKSGRRFVQRQLAYRCGMSIVTPLICYYGLVYLTIRILTDLRGAISAPKRTISDAKYA